MTRVEKNNNKYVGKKVVKKKEFKHFILNIIRNIIFFIVGLYYMIYTTLRFINNLVSRLFMKLPRLARVLIVYTLIGVIIYQANNVKTIVKEVVKEEELVITFEPKEEIKTQEVVKKEPVLNDIEMKIYKRAIELGLDENQSLIAVAISKQETGNWTSNAFKNKNNFGGVMCKSGLRYYYTFEQGLDGFLNLLKNHYFNKGLDTIEKIGAVYAPIGATNDKNNVNRHWIPNVTQFYNEYMRG